MPDSPIRRQEDTLRWRGVDVLAYKREGAAPFRDVTRQVLFDDPALACQLRYFEVGPDGHTTLERHEHAHAVVILRGRGRVLVGDAIHDAPLGSLCMVNAERDRPQLPSADDLARLRANPAIAAFLRT
jgi:hypothetical protein